MKDPYEQGMKEPAKLPQPIRLASDSLSDVFSSQGSPAPNFAQYIARLQNSEYLPSIVTLQQVITVDQGHKISKNGIVERFY